MENTGFSKLETAMHMMVCVFHEYAAKDKEDQGKGGSKGASNKPNPNDFKLNKKELKELLNKELPNFMEGMDDPKEVEKLLKELDDDGDGQMNFQEFVVLIASLSCICNQIMECLMGKEAD